MIARREFNKNLDTYIRQRRKSRKPGLLRKLFTPSPKESHEPPMNEELQHELKELQQEEERHHKKERGFFARLFGKKPKDPTQEEIDALAASTHKIEETLPTLPEDAKEAIKALHRWLEKLPQKRLEEFKNSEDFQLYKEVLTKYGIARKKEEIREME